MESIAEFIMCIFTQNRKSDEPVFKLPNNTPLNDEKFNLIKECFLVWMWFRIWRPSSCLSKSKKR